MRVALPGTAIGFARIARALIVAVALEASGAVAPVMLQEPVDAGNVNLFPLQPIDGADWIWGEGGANTMLFRRRFSSEKEKVRIHVSADNRYTLKLDGRRIARGPERGTVENWTYRTLDLDLEPGEHVLEAVVIRLNETFHNNVSGNEKPAVPGAPLAQLAWWKTPGFVLRAEGRLDETLTTGKGAWKVRPFSNVRMADERGGSFGIGGSNVIEGDSPWHAEPADLEFSDVRVVRRRIYPNHYGCVQDGWRLHPTGLPPQMDEVKSPGRVRAISADIAHDHVYVEDEAAEELPRIIPANSAVNILWDLEDYYCGYPELEVSGGRGARVEFGWSEAMRDAATGRKGLRSAFAGKRISCFNDVFLPDGGTNGFTTTWWRSGRWLRLIVKTAEEPLEIRRFAISEVRYPLVPTARFDCDDPTLDAVQSMCTRTLAMCSHEMSFDCPFYEQQMYPGDTRIQLLVHGVLSSDARLPQRDIELFDLSRRDNGMVGFNFPTTMAQDGASYTFMFPMMLADFALWRDDAAWLKRRMPGLVHTMEGLRVYENSEGLISRLPGWNFHDWADWPGSSNGGCAEAAGTNAVNNLLYIHALSSAATVADALGDREFAAAYRARAHRTSAAVVRTFWDEVKGLLSDDLGRRSYSEHTQSLALILDVLSPEKAARVVEGLLTRTDLVRTTVYFQHYLFEAYAKIGRGELILKRLDLWRDYVAKGLKTAQEMPDTEARESRSDCHAWGAHPLYHLHASVLGIRPSAPFFGAVRIAPQPGTLRRIDAVTPTPKGNIVSSLEFGNGEAHGRIVLPNGLSGEFVWEGRRMRLVPGDNTF